MFKVLLVDDEAIIRKGVKNLINWEELECIVCGEAGDGITGIEKIKELKPDIIIADIRMPGMDGLIMIKETKDLIPQAKFIILTGYRDFEYIHKAIKLGAFDYILKPSKIDDIKAVVKKSVNELNKERLKEEEVRSLRRSIEEQIPLIKQKLLYDLLFNINLKITRVEEELKLCKLVVEDFVLIIVDSDFSFDSDMPEDSLIYQQGIINSFLDVFSEKFHTEFLIISENRIVFVVQPLETASDLLKAVEEALQNFKDIVCGCFNLCINTAFSSVGSGVWSLRGKMKETLKSLNKAYGTKGNSILSYDNIRELNKNNESLLMTHITEKNIEEESMKLALRKAIDYIKSNYKDTLTLNDVAEHTYVSTYYLSRLFTKELGKSFVDFLNEIRIGKAKEYLRQDNYKTYEVAEMVGIKDAHYFSKLFKKYTGSTPSEFKERI